MISGTRRRSYSRRVLRCLSRFCSWLPVVFITIFIVWVYYVAVFVVMIFQGPGLPDKPIAVRVILLLIGHVLLFLLISTYLRAIFGKHKKVPEQFHLSPEVVDRVVVGGTSGQSSLEDATADLPVYAVSRSGGVRWCAECRVVKPDRCHHCSSCERCVLKMDHHCPWISNCVGYSNYKFFLLFLFYTVFVCVYIDIATAYDFSHIWTGITQTLGGNATTGEQFEYYWTKVNVIFMFFLVFCFGFATSILLFFHIYLVCSNKTTIENMEPIHLVDGKDSGIFNVGIRKNLKQVFGSNVILAFLPIFTSEGDGVEFAMRRDVLDLSEAKAQQASRRRHRASRSEGPSEPNLEDTEEETSETQPLRH